MSSTEPADPDRGEQHSVPADNPREEAMRSAFTAWFGIQEALTAADDAGERTQLREQAAAVAAAWETGPDAAEWRWLRDTADAWRVAPDRMRTLTDDVRHDLVVGQSTHTRAQYRSLDQVGRLLDTVYVQQTQWRDEHVALAARHGRLDAQLHAANHPGLADRIRDAKSRAWDTIWGDNTDNWSPTRRAWENSYAMDPANRDQERATYLSAYTTESQRLARARTTGTDAPVMERDPDRTRVERLLTATTAVPSASTAAPNVEPDPAATTALDTYPAYRETGHDLG
ncbi:hypothetical protein [Nocardia sp. alder85J]|uniref:hypothetical protein n=1 Tax=Nocardia sp. alder85J TaxID=2862949 RepID=UPI001CD6D102|nr:hypothetical protein [Nocardia sp. alder85J]MCX4098422.1 hypothetical protein [Nocardia sp. alder85J]